MPPRPGSRESSSTQSFTLRRSRSALTGQQGFHQPISISSSPTCDSSPVNPVGSRLKASSFTRAQLATSLSNSPRTAIAFAHCPSTSLRRGRRSTLPSCKLSPLIRPFHPCLIPSSLLQFDGRKSAPQSVWVRRQGECEDRRDVLHLRQRLARYLAECVVHRGEVKPEGLRQRRAPSQPWATPKDPVRPNI